MNPQAEPIQEAVFARVVEEAEEWGLTGEDPGPDNGAPLTSKEILRALDSNEDGDARLFIDRHRGRFLFDHAAGQWFEWAGHFWREDTIDRATEALNAVIDVYGTEAGRQQWERLKAEKAGQSDRAKKHAAIEDALLKRIRALQSKGRKENVLFLARTGGESLAIRGDEWDLNPWLLCCLNGVIDLQTGEHRPGRPDDFIKTVAPTEWKGLNEPAPIWERFLMKIFDGEADVGDIENRPKTDIVG